MANKVMKAYIYALLDSFRNVKLGCTEYPVHRLAVYRTGDAPGHEKEYYAVWEVNADTFRSMLSIERAVHRRFLKDRMYRRTGRSTEWFTTPLTVLDEWMAAQPFVTCRLSPSELEDIRRNAETASPSEISTANEEDRVLDEIDSTFFSKFLPGNVPRRIQQELWTIFENVCDNHPGGLYKGIVQWPTGVGKTIAMLIMIVLAAERFKRMGKVYRCLLVSPKNDILKTLISQLEQLRFFGITLLDGSEGKLSTVTIPLTQHVVVIATHSALTDKSTLERLPPMNHVHYDEVHRITGKVFLENLKEMVDIWGAEYLTGTSATPETSSPSQRQKLVDLFGESLSVIHRCDIDEAVKEGWIAPPRYHISVLENNKDRNAVLEAYVRDLIETARLKQALGGLRTGKIIAYIESSIEDVQYASKYAKSNYPDIKFYSAINGERDDSEFVAAASDGTLRIMIVCQRYREGSDVRGVEMTSMLVGDSAAAYIILQVCGRGMRLDYPEKEAWIHIARPSEERTTPDDVKNHIVLDVLEYIQGKKEGGAGMSSGEIADTVRSYFGNLRVNGVLSDLDETIRHVQELYTRREVGKRKTPRERYADLQKINRDLGLTSKVQYEDSEKRHPCFIPDPKKEFAGYWTSWYDYLGIDTCSFPPTKSEFHRVCRDRGIYSWDDYKMKKDSTLPEHPDEFYHDWTNASDEFPDDRGELIW
uniref:Helicase ATP-binding domain-containing protein n=1 Tax=viral metagenome TaxID=1070528 RepID=A0A6C0HMH2_9ZZZZ